MGKKLYSASKHRVDLSLNYPYNQSVLSTWLADLPNVKGPYPGSGSAFVLRTGLGQGYCIAKFQVGDASQAVTRLSVNSGNIQIKTLFQQGLKN